MKYFLPCTLIFLLIAGCDKYEPEEPFQGQVVFSGLSHQQFEQNEPGARLQGTSSWQHIYSDQVVISIFSQDSGEAYELEFNPNDFSQDHRIQLPYGHYTYSVQMEGEDMEDHLPFRAEGDFALESGSINIILQGETDYGLLTVRNELLETVSINGNVDLAQTDNGVYFFKYIRKGEEVGLNIASLDGEHIFEESVEIDSYQHYHFFLQLIEEANVNFIELAIGEFRYEEVELDGISAVGSLVIDADDNVYKTVRIGSQTWMAENLRTTKFCNGDEIANIPGSEAWDDMDESAWTYYEDDPANNTLYGKLYNDVAMLDPRNLCPCGWRVPDRADWDQLVEYVGGPQTGGGALKATGFSQWRSPNTGATNETGFNALPGGAFTYNQTFIEFYDPFNMPSAPEYSYRYMFGFWWSTTSYDAEDGWRYYFVMNLNYMQESINVVDFEGRNAGLSIRCIKNE